MTNIVAPTLNARLACACNCAYDISTTSGHYSPQPQYSVGAGWQGTPTAFAKSLNGTSSGSLINACLVGLTTDGIVVAFRGTIPPQWTRGSIEDWLQDIIDVQPVQASSLPGKVHAGFWNALCTLWDELLAQINSLKQQHGDAKIYITGHSKGGPMASLCAARLSFEAHVDATEVVTFASPHAGDTAFVNGFPANIPVTRFENYLDLVPFLPPTQAFFEDVNWVCDNSIGEALTKLLPKDLVKAWNKAANWDYAPLGRLQYVTDKGHVVSQSDSRADAWWRLLDILGSLFDTTGDPHGLEGRKAQLNSISTQLSSEVQISFSKIGDAHCIACKGPACAGGYMTGAGGSPICG